jgi:hypothetical protein
MYTIVVKSLIRLIFVETKNNFYIKLDVSQTTRPEKHVSFFFLAIQLTCNLLLSCLGVFTMGILNRTLILLLIHFCILSQALRFHVPSNEKKCLKEEIHRNVVVTGEYEFSEAIGTTASVHVSFCLFFN